MASETPVAMIYTEGKTDWKHLKKAKEKLNINLPVVFYESETSLGSPELLNLCQYLSKRTDNELPGICLFDRDEPKILKKVVEKEQPYKNWDNKFFSFVLPIPEHRQGFDENICIEFYYSDDELRTTDVHGRRLFLSTEFKEPSGRHKYNGHLLLGRNHQSKITTEDTKAKILDSDVFDQNDTNVALSKDDFAENIFHDVASFDNFNFEAFRKIFDSIAEIICHEITPSTQPEQNEDGLPAKFFIGREAQFAEFEKCLKRNKPLSIEGLGGIGKTEFAKKCIEKFQLAERAVWFPCTRNSTLDSLIEIAGFPDLLKVENRTELAKYSGFAGLIERTEKILFLDDFQEVTDPAFAKFFQFADKRLQKAKIVLIAREHPEIGVLTSPIHLEGLDDQSALHYARQIAAGSFPELIVSDLELEQICRNCKGHPLAIELAIYMLDMGMASANILHALVVYEDEEFLAHRLLDEIFNHPKSTPEEKEFMCVFSVFRGKVRESALTHLFKGRNLASTLRALRRKLMLMYADGCYETHPLVREFCYDRLTDKQAWHQKAAAYFQTERREIFDPGLEETLYYHLVEAQQWQEIAGGICVQGEQFILRGYTTALQEMMDTVATHGIHPPKFHIFYGEIAKITGKLDEALHHWNQAFSFYEESGDKAGIADSLNGLGVVLQIREDLTGAWEKYHTSLTLYEEIGHKAGIANALINLGGILYAQGKLQDAQDIYHASLMLSEEIGNKAGIAMSLNNLGFILHNRGDLQGAWEKYHASLTLYEEIGHKAGIANALINLGGILQDQRKLQDAWDKYHASLLVHEEIGDKAGITTSYHNLGTLAEKQKKYALALQYLLQAQALQNQIGIKQEKTRDYIFQVRKMVGLLHFKTFIQEAFALLPQDLQAHMNVAEFTADTTIRYDTPKVGRNDPCPCGSGKKYKKCCGR